MTARLNQDKTLMQVTGNGCTACGTQANYEATLDIISTASGANLSNLKAGDPWGNKYSIDENEGETPGNPCRQRSSSAVTGAGSHPGLTSTNYTILHMPKLRNYMIHKQKGFTIVELLIVIVVIGILAAITIVAYNNVQTRANNTTTINGVAAYVKIFQMYAADNETYPSTTGYPCLGSNLQGNCGRMVQGSPGCGYSGTAQGGGVATTFSNQLSPYAKNLPSISDQTMGCNGDIYTGAYVNPNSSNAKNMQIVVFLKAGMACPPKLASASLDAPYSSTTDQTSRCWYNLPTLP